MCNRSRAYFGLFFLLIALRCFSAAESKKFHQELETIFSSYEKKAEMGLHVISLGTHATLYEKAKQQPFFPGSTTKLFVAAAAFDVLKPQFTFRTEIVTNGPIISGVVQGDLILKGSGDPSLKLKDLEDLVFQLKLKNIKEIKGNIIIDGSEFDDIKLGPGWLWEDNLHARFTPIEALVLNQGLVDVWIKPSDVAMMSPSVHIEPIVPGIAIENKAIMAQIDPFQKSLKVKKKLVKGKDVIAVEGAMSLKAAPLKFSIPVRHPAQFAATEFSLILKKTGIKHEGKIVFEHAGATAQVLATHLSDPLFDLTRKMLKSNNDLYANCLLKKIGRVRFGKPGTWPNGSQASREFLKKIIDWDLHGAVLVDGSGESGYNTMTPEIMTLFLKQLHQKFVYGPEFMACMPLSGVDGCFKKRFKEKSFYSKLRGFSFSNEKDSCLCGYLMTNQQENLAFCLMIKQSEPYQQISFSEIEDRICEALFKYAKGK